MRYFYLKIGMGNREASDWLAGKNPLNRPAAVIYFDPFSEDEYRNGEKGKTEPRRFVEMACASHRNEVIMVVINSGELWLLRPEADVVFLPAIEEGKATRKAMPVGIIKRIPLTEVPLVLAGIGANQHYSRGTFREIRDWGNMKAIDFVAGRRGMGPHWKLEDQHAGRLLGCLSSMEIETLVAKLFEASGCFVPASRGGTLKDIDLFAHNRTGKRIEISRIALEPGKRISIQIKRWSKQMMRPDTVDYLIGLDATGPGAFDAEWILERVIERDSVREWLYQSLEWLTPEILNRFGLNAA